MDNDSRFGRASIAQVAALLGQEEDEVAAEATRLAGEAAAARGWLTPSAVSALVAGASSRLAPIDAETLILTAFQQAQESAKTEWSSMAVPVLKNRLLQISSKKFQESDYGSPNIWHFVTLFPHLLACEDATPRERVRLLDPSLIELDEGEMPAALDPAGRWRIRQDLWRALFDYSSQHVYVWDELTGRARVRLDRDESDIPVVPTLSVEDLNQIRGEFVALQTSVPGHEGPRLKEWASSGGPTIALPRQYRGLWNAHLKSHAANRLRAFFLAADLDVPQDLMGSPRTSKTEPEREVERIRRLAHRYVDAMTADELSRLSIEMAVLLRVPPLTDR